MRTENQNGIFSTQAPIDNNVNDFHKRSKISYIRDALISLSNLDKSKIPPEGFDSSIICEYEDAATLDSDSTSGRSSPAHLSQNCVRDGILGKVGSVKVTRCSVPEGQSKSDRHLLHKSDEPYRPPHLYKKTSESKKMEACKNLNVGYSDGTHHLESEDCNKVVHMLLQSDGGTSENCPSWRKPLKEGTLDEWQSLAALMTGFIGTDRESELETYVYPTWMFRNGCQSPGFTRDNSFTIPGSSSIVRNPTGFNVGIEKVPNLNHDSGSDHASDLGVELNLPDEDSLHTFDDTYFLPGKEEIIGYEDFTISSERNSITEKSSASSFPIDVDENLVEFVPDDEPPCLLNDVTERVAEHVLKDLTPCSVIDMVEMRVESELEDETLTLSPDLAEKLIGSVLDDEPRSPSPPIDLDKLVDSILDENPNPLYSVDSPLPTNFVGKAACLSCQKLHLERSYPQFHHMHLNPESHGQVHGNTQKESPNTETGSLPSHLFSPSMISHSVHPFDGEQRRFKCKKGLPLLHLVPTGDTFPFPWHQRVHRETAPHLPAAYSMSCYERDLSPLQIFTAHQQPNYWVYPVENPGLHAYRSYYNNSQAALDGLLSMRLRGMHTDT